MIGRLVVLGAGVALGVWAVTRVQRLQRALRPDALVAGATARADDLGGRLRRAVAEGRAAADAKEAQLRAAYGVGDALR